MILKKKTSGGLRLLGTILLTITLGTTACAADSANSESAAALSETAAVQSESAAALSETAVAQSEPAAVQGESAAVPGETVAAQSESAAAQGEPQAVQGEPVAAFSPSELQGEAVSLDMSWPWAANSAVHTGTATLYRVPEGGTPARKNITVCVNAGHGTPGGEGAQTLSHPDGTPKVTGGTNAEGAVYSMAISTGMTFLDGTPEAEVNLQVAMYLKEKLLADGYDVLMIRESNDVQLDNIARTVIANQYCDLHVAIHFDSTDYDKGCFFMSVPDVASYRAMEPVASHWEEHLQLGQALIGGLQGVGLYTFSDGMMQMDLTQTSYSTIPSVDIEVGDAASSHTPEACEVYAQGLKDGIDVFAQQLGQQGQLAAQ